MPGTEQGIAGFGERGFDDQPVIEWGVEAELESSVFVEAERQHPGNQPRIDRRDHRGCRRLARFDRFVRRRWFVLDRLGFGFDGFEGVAAECVAQL